MAARRRSRGPAPWPSKVPGDGWCASPVPARIEAREGNLLPLEFVLSIAITPGFLLASVLWLVGLVAPRLRAVLEPVANGLLLLSFLVAVAAVRTRQVLIEGRGVRAFWQTFGRRFRERVGTRAVAITIARGL